MSVSIKARPALPCLKMMKNSSPSGRKGWNAWMKWMNANRASIVEGGAPLGKKWVGGYSIVQAESHDAATKIFGNDHPHLQMPGS